MVVKVDELLDEAAVLEEVLGPSMQLLLSVTPERLERELVELVRIRCKDKTVDARSLDADSSPVATPSDELVQAWLATPSGRYVPSLEDLRDYSLLRNTYVDSVDVSRGFNEELKIIERVYRSAKRVKRLYRELQPAQKKQLDSYIVALRYVTQRLLGKYANRTDLQGDPHNNAEAADLKATVERLIKLGKITVKEIQTESLVYSLKSDRL